MDDLLDQIVLADQVGLDVFGIGEHHPSERVNSAPPVILGAAATRTKSICLTSPALCATPHAAETWAPLVSTTLCADAVDENRGMRPSTRVG
jgi:alkanesulfonate monooxygenase SsuD/methylene tetrahydromethanopterin reductase-like flavin-dependent oxidoreductase (luciferase family)